jgi:hypothetical protein
MPPEYFEVDSKGKCNQVTRGLRVAVDGTGHKNPRSLARSWAVCLTTRMLSMFPDDNEFNIKITKQKNKQVHFNVEVTRVS